MASDKKPSVEKLRALGQYESLREILLSKSCPNHLDKPLAYWAVATDRRLPLALLGRSLGELLDASFEEIAATPGVGDKKILALIKLLARAADTDPAQLPVDLNTKLRKGAGKSAAETAARSFDPSVVSEVHWLQWRDTVVKRGLEHELLGRFAPTLKNMTRVIWTKPLGDYTGLSLADIRAMKTHGQKRVRAVLEVFHSIHQLVGTMGGHELLVVRIVPRAIDAVENWVGRNLQTPRLPGTVEIFEKFTKPLLTQIRIDATRQVVRLAEDRLGINGSITSVRQAARSAGLTRARVYQLLNEINDMISVRWPLGRHQVHALRAKFQSETAATSNPSGLEQFLTAVELFYPTRRRGTDGAGDGTLPDDDCDEAA